MTESTQDIDKLSAEIVHRSREARFAGISPEVWTQRIESLISAHEQARNVAVTGLKPVDEAAGGSNGTLVFEGKWTSSTGEQETADLVLRFLPTRGLFHAYDVRAQFLIQKALGETPVPAAPQRWLDEQGEHLGVPGYVMDRVAGRSTPMTWMTSGLYVDATPTARRHMQRAFINILAQIHKVDWQALGMDFLLARAEGNSPIAKEVQRYWDSLEWSGDSEYKAALSPIKDWLTENVPMREELVLCHGDTNLGNYLFDGTDINAVLDWEMAFIGHPECDLAMFVVGNESLQSGVQRPEGTFSDAEFVSEYERASGTRIRDWPYYELFATYRSAVITLLARKHFHGDFLERFNQLACRSVEATLERGAALGITQS